MRFDAVPVKRIQCLASMDSGERVGTQQGVCLVATLFLHISQESFEEKVSVLHSKVGGVNK